MPALRERVEEVGSLVAESVVIQMQQHGQTQIPQQLQQNQTVAYTAALLRQLADFSDKTARTFKDLHDCTKSAQTRIDSLSGRVKTACSNVARLEEKSAAMVRGDIPPMLGVEADVTFPDPESVVTRLDWKPTPDVPTEDLPSWALSTQERLNRCTAEPDFGHLDQFTEDGRAGTCMKFFSNPEYFVDQCVKERQEEMEKAKQEKKQRRKERRERRQKMEQGGRVKAEKAELKKKQFKAPEFSEIVPSGRAMTAREKPPKQKLYSVVAADANAMRGIAPIPEPRVVGGGGSGGEGIVSRPVSAMMSTLSYTSNNIQVSEQAPAHDYTQAFQSISAARPPPAPAPAPTAPRPSRLCGQPHLHP